MKRTIVTMATVLAAGALIGLGVAWARPDLVPPWARIGKAHSAGDGHDHGDAPAGGEHKHAPGEKGYGEGDKEKGGHEEGGHAEEAKLSAEAVKQNGVQVAPVGKHILIPTFTAPARVAYNAEAMAHVGSPVTGRVAELKVRVGDRVKQGDVLLVLQSPELVEAQSEYLQRRTAARTAAPTVDLAKNSFERAERIRAETRGGIALNEVQKRQADLRAAEATLQAAQSAVTAAESKLRQLGMDQAAIDRLTKTSRTDPRYTIVAPIAGQVVEREVTLGELVDPQQESLLVLADLSILWVLADVPEARSQDVAVGAKARVVTSAGGKEGLEGTVTFLAPAIDRETRTVPVRIVVRDAGTTLRPGMFVRAEIETTRPGAATGAVLAVPEAAIQTVEGRPSVFVPVAGEENTFAARPVVAGRVVGGMVPVLGGLKEGEPVVVAGSFILKAELGKGGAAHEH